MATLKWGCKLDSYYKFNLNNLIFIPYTVINTSTLSLQPPTLPLSLPPQQQRCESESELSVEPRPHLQVYFFTHWKPSMSVFVKPHISRSPIGRKVLGGLLRWYFWLTANFGKWKLKQHCLDKIEWQVVTDNTNYGKKKKNPNFFRMLSWSFISMQLHEFLNN